MSNEQHRKDVPYLPRSWGSNAGAKKSSRPHSLDTEASALDPDPGEGPVTLDLTSSSIDTELTGQEHIDGKPPWICTDFSQSSCTCQETGPMSAPSEASIGQPSEELSGSKRSNTSDMAFPDADKTSSRITLSVCGVRFGYAGRIYHFEATGIELLQGDWVIVKTEKGVGLGHVAIPPFEREMDQSQIEGLRKVLRKAGKVDFSQKERCVQKEKEAYDFCLDKICEFALPMKLVEAECFFDASKYVFYFTAEGRVDFRELVKELVSRFPVRIEMRQIGVRHEAKMIGGLACCGQELCCSRFLTDFRPVSVKMAKNQNLSLNPIKISGVCGRLMCCLGFEHDTYEEFKKGLPKIGRSVRTPKGEGVVLKHDPLAETVFVRLSEETIVEMTRDEIVAELEQSATMDIETKEEDYESPEEIPDQDESEEG